MSGMNISNAKILILGTNGQLGGSFYKLLSTQKGVTFTDLAPKNDNVRALDFTDLNALSGIIKTLKPDVIINCVAYTAVDLAEKEHDLAMKINAEAVAVIAKAAGELGAVFIHYSTDYVFDGSGSTPWKESDLTSPVNAYGASKLAGETATLKQAPKGYVFRTQWVYDKTGKNFVKTMLRLGAEREELSVVGDQIGAPTSSDVIAKFTLKALDKILSGKMSSGIYHLCCRGEISWHTFAEEIFRQAKALGKDLKVQRVKKIETKDFPTPAARPKNSRLSLTKFETAIGENLPDWKDALTDVMKHP
jgi:dTDP-4-dehydrorhamnose reductase